MQKEKLIIKLADGWHMEVPSAEEREKTGVLWTLHAPEEIKEEVDEEENKCEE